MQRTTELFKNEIFFQNDLHLLVNRYSENFHAPFHAHEFIEYCYVAEGRGFHHLENEIFAVRKGMLFVIPVGAPHVFRPASSDTLGNRLIVYNCLFDMQMVEQLNIVLQEPSIREHLATLGSSSSSYFSVSDRDGSIERLMLNLYHEMSVSGMGSKTMLYTLLSQLIIAVYRQKYGEDDKSTMDMADFTQVIQYLEHNLSEKITLAELARISQWSSRHLQRMFHKHTGQSFGTYLKNLRVHKSCELLRTSGHKINMIAELVGYRDIDSFNAVFKKIVGQTPIAYRKLYRS
ncbi:hypothetical protein BK125_11340 [Paenibacillus odorifer]|uniref:AraC family transcriptional regulator n=1 Tax=Paenibacillus odorifer TaxID=189426 RepID=UPI00096EE116|nr:AraC family transcriptional regulator [Paenibacillus odorifer]OMC78149.1 hypothetical protein BK125_11340 [Paenibacillus odorifer]